MLPARCIAPLLKPQSIGKCSRGLIISTRINTGSSLFRAYSKVPQNTTNLKNNNITKSTKITPIQPKKPQQQQQEEEDEEEEEEDLPDVNTKDPVVGTLKWDKDNGYVGKTTNSKKEEIYYSVLAEETKEIMGLVSFMKKAIPKLEKLDIDGRSEAAHDYIMTEEEKIVYKTSGKWRYQARVRDRLEKRARLSNQEKHHSESISSFSAPKVEIQDGTEYVVTFNGIITLEEFKERLGKIKPAYLFFYGEEEQRPAVAVSYGDDGMFSNSHFLVEFNEMLEVDNVSIEG